MSLVHSIEGWFFCRACEHNWKEGDYFEYDEKESTYKRYSKEEWFKKYE